MVYAALTPNLRGFAAAMAAGAKGNVATEAVVAHLHHHGFATGIDMARLNLAVSFAKGLRSL